MPRKHDSDEEMKLQKNSRWFSVLLCVAIFAGCRQSTESTTISSPVTPTLPISSVTLTETISPILTPSATVTLTPSTTPTDIPPLPADDALNRLLDLLASNGDCKLPCLWGITPGASNYQEARNILMPLSNISPAELTYFGALNGFLGGTITPLYVEGALRLNARIGYLYGDDDIVSSIDFRALEERLSKDEYGNQITTPIFDSPTFMKRVQYYSLSHVLTEQGMPASVMIQASGWGVYSLELDAMDLVLLYPDQGIWVHYIMPNHFKQIDVEAGCPANAHIEMELYPSGNPDSFFSLLDQTDWRVTKNGYKPLEEATSMSIAEFYQTFRNSTDKCIETPTNIWPTPEPRGG